MSNFIMTDVSLMKGHRKKVPFSATNMRNVLKALMKCTDMHTISLEMTISE